VSTKIKICGLFRQEDARAVNAAMPDYAGFVFHAKSRRNVSPEPANALRAALHPDIRTVGVFVNAPVEQVAQLYKNGVISVSQLHGTEDHAYIQSLRKACPYLEIWQAFRVRAADDLHAAAQSPADLVLLDGGAGGGRTFDWPLARAFPRPFVLAGGLTPETIPGAIRQLRPFAVDLSSGVETDGVKDFDKIQAAVRAARRQSE